MDEQIGAVLDCVPRLRGRERFVTPLRGSVTNRSFLVDTDDGSFILRIADEQPPGLDRSGQQGCAPAAAASGAGPEVVASLPEHNALVTRFVPGRLLHPLDIQEPGTMGRVVDALRRHHNGPPGTGSFSPFATVREYYTLAWNRQVGFSPVIGEAMQRFLLIEDAVHSDDPPCPCHNDLSPASIIDDGARVYIVNWDRCGRGDRLFDLGCLAAGAELDGTQEQTLLALYFGAVHPEHLRRLRLMRLVSDLREALRDFLRAAAPGPDSGSLEHGRAHLERFLQKSEGLERTRSSVRSGASR